MTGHFFFLGGGGGDPGGPSGDPDKTYRPSVHVAFLGKMLYISYIKC